MANLNKKQREAFSQAIDRIKSDNDVLQNSQASRQIAPVMNKRVENTIIPGPVVNNNQVARNILTKGNLKDGYQFGDFTRTILNTAEKFNNRMPAQKVSEDYKSKGAVENTVGKADKTVPLLLQQMEKKNNKNSSIGDILNYNLPKVNELNNKGNELKSIKSPLIKQSETEIGWGDAVLNDVNLFGSTAVTSVKKTGASIPYSLLTQATQGYGNDKMEENRLYTDYKQGSFGELKQQLDRQNAEINGLRTSNIEKTRQNLRGYIDKQNEVIQNNISEASNDFSRKLLEIEPSIIQSGIGAGVTLGATALTGNGGLGKAIGTIFFSESAYTDYYDDAIERGLTGSSANKFATAMAFWEGASEEFITANRLIPSKSVREFAKGLFADVFENFTQEALTVPLQEMLAKASGGDYDYSDLGKRMLSDGFDGALTSLISFGATNGVASSINIYHKLMNNENVTVKELEGAVQDLMNIEGKEVVETQLQIGTQATMNNILQRMVKNIDSVQKNSMQNNEVLQDNEQITQIEDRMPENVNMGKNSKQNRINEAVDNYIQKLNDNFETGINIDTSILNNKNVPINYSTQKQSFLFNKAKQLFKGINRTVFKNNNQDIYVTNSDIHKSISETVRNKEQTPYAKENVAVFSQLDKIIENAELLDTQSIDRKGREQFSNYEYYVSKANIDEKPYIVEFDTRMQEGSSGKQERHFRLERVYPVNEKVGSVTGAENSTSQLVLEPTYIDSVTASNAETLNTTSETNSDTNLINTIIPQNENKMQVQNENITKNDKNSKESSFFMQENLLPIGENVKRNKKQVLNEKNSLANSQEMRYNNLKLGERKNISTKELMSLHNKGGYRSNEQIANLRRSIEQNGITEPIEIYRRNDGTYGIENGNHRLQIANELGIENVPVKLVDSWENVGVTKDNTEINILNERIDENDGSNTTSKGSIETNERSGSSRGRLYDLDEQSQNRGTTEGDVGVSKRTSNSDEQTSYVENEGNSGKIENSHSSSFFMQENLLPIGENVKRNKKQVLNEKNSLANSQEMRYNKLESESGVNGQINKMQNISEQISPNEGRILQDNRVLQENKMLQNASIIQDKTYNEMPVTENNSKSFSEQIDNYVQGKFPTGEYLNLGKTPKVLTDLGLKENPIILKNSKLKTILKENSDGTSHEHGIPVEIMKKLPDALSNPLNVLKSGNDSVVVITDLADIKERPIIASIKMNFEGKINNIEFLSNKLTSAYGKRNYDRYMQDEIAKGNMIYDIDEGIIKEATTTGLQLPKEFASSEENSSINTIIPQNKNKMQVQNENITKNDKNSKESSFSMRENIAPIGENVKRNKKQVLNEKNSLANSQEIGYNNLKLGERKNISTKELMSLHNKGGYRSNEQIANLRRSIEQNGITEPIEIYRRNDGTYGIENGNHRLQIANELGIENVPVKLVDSWENVSVNSETIQKEKINEIGEDYANGIGETNNKIDEGRRSSEGSLYEIYELSYNRGTTEGDVGVSKRTSNSDEQTSYVENKGNSGKIENSHSSSFSMQENIAPIGENVKRNKILNPTEIGNTTLEEANTTPELKTKKYEKGNKESNFYPNITEDSNFLKEDLRKELSKEENIQYYQGITNKETLEKAYENLSKEGKDGTLNWFSKENKNANAEDVAKGWILLKQYQDNGDYRGAVEIAKKMRDIGTTAGQTVQAYNILSRLTPEGMFYYAQSELSEAYNKMVEGKSKEWIEKNRDKFDLNPQETEMIMNNMQEMIGLKDEYEKKAKIAEIQKIVCDKIPSTMGKSIKAWMRISMLFNPKTQVRNVLGNAVIAPINVVSDMVSSAVDKVVAQKTGVRTTGMTNLKNFGKGFGKGLYESYQDFRRGINTREIEGNRFEVSNGKSFSDNNIIGRNLNRVDSFLNFVMDAGDRPFYEATFVNSINNQLVLNHTTEVTQDMIDIATTEALQRTWQDDNKYTQTVLKIREAMNAGMDYGVGDILIPFAKTPANLTKAIVDYSPVGLANALVNDLRTFKNSLKNGQYTPQIQHRFVQNFGKGMFGSLLYVIGYGLAKTGISTGDSADDKDEKNFIEKLLGVSSYSIKIGNKTFTYDWAQPIAAPLSITANIVNSENKTTALMESVLGNLDTAGSVILEQSFLESLNEVLNDKEGVVSGVINQVLDLPARAVPTFSKQIADMVDGTQRTTFEYDKPIKSAVNSIVAKIPIASKSLTSAVDTLGNEVQKYGGENTAFNVFFNPANMNRGQETASGKEIYRLYEETGETRAFPVTAPNYINYKGEKIIMTAEQKGRYQRITGKYTDKAINELLANSAYKDLSDSEKVELISEIISDSNQKAKYEVLNIESEEAMKQRKLIEEISTNNYYDYKLKVMAETNQKQKTEKDNTVQLKDVEKMKIIANGKYSTKAKETIYKTYIMEKADEGEQTQYEKLKDYYKSEKIIDQYLDYKVKANDKLKELKAKGKVSEESSKLTDNVATQVLVDSQYSKEQTEALYVNVVASESNKNKYENLKNINKSNSIDAYLKFILSERESDKEDDGTKSGKTIDGTKKKKIFNTIESLNISKIAKIYLYGTEYNLNTKAEKHNYNALLSYINTLSKPEQVKIVKTLNGKTEMKDGSYSW